MSKQNNTTESPHWAGFKKLWIIVAIILFLLLLILWLMGYGPNGKNCQVEPKIVTKEIEKIVEVEKIIEKMVVTPDTIAPRIKLASSTVKLMAGATFTGSALAVDNIDGDVDVKITGNVDNKTPGEYLLTYTATDAAGNTSTESQTVIVEAVPDTEAPQLALNGSSLIKMPLGSSYSEQGATAIDNIDGEVKTVITGNVDTNTLGEYLVNYKATDIAGNTSTESRKVIIEAAPDTEAPRLSLKGLSVTKVFVGFDYLDLGAIATDDVDGELKTVVTGNVDTNTVGEYLLSYKATDAAGNTSTESRKVIVEPIPDTEAPRLVLNGSSTTTITLGSDYSDPGATATDDIDGKLETIVIGNVDTNTIGEYFLNYKATDAAGNKSTTSRKIIVEAIPDTEAPRIYLKGLSTTKVTVGTDYSDVGATAIDDADGNIDVKTKGTVDTNTVGEYLLEYTATDAAGNTASVSRKVIVEAALDSIAPVLSIIGDSVVLTQKGSTYEDLGARVTDNIDTNIVVDTTGNVDTNTLGEYIITYTVTDSAGNTASDTRMVIVEATQEEVAAVPPAASKLYFENNSAESPADTELTLPAVISYLRNNSDSKAVISGFHSASGQLAYNQALSKKRALSVQDLLNKSGIFSSRMIIEDPVQTRGTGSAREARRVEVRISTDN